MAPSRGHTQSETPSSSPSRARRRRRPGPLLLVAAASAGLLASTTAASAPPLTPPRDLARLIPSSPPPSCTPTVRRSITWGVATSAAQIEGGATKGGRTPSIWDAFSARSPPPIAGSATPTTAVDHFSRYEQDYDLMQSLGITAHRFSISWSRLVPGGKAGSPVSPEGVRFYQNLARAMRARGIAPVATLYHWDLPQSLQDSYGGWLDRRVVDDFAYYAEAAFKALGATGLVSHWLTINEPGVICDQGYNQGTFAPGIKGGRKAMYTCGHNLLLAHSRAVALCRKILGIAAAGSGCKISLAMNVVFYEPLDPADLSHVRAANNALERESGWFLDPIVRGDYPAILKRAAVDAGLPAFSDAEKNALRGSFDFLAINTYTGYYAFDSPGRPDGYRISNATRGEALLEARRGGSSRRQQSSSSSATPDGNTDGRDVSLLGSVDSAIPGALGNALRYLGKRYGKQLPLWVTEFGVGVPGEHARRGGTTAALDDSSDRVVTLATYADGVCRAAASGEANVRAVFAWTFFDNFEWLYGYQLDFGLVDVDFVGGTLERRPKVSAFWFSRWFWRDGSGESAAAKLVP